jgi:Ca2+-binding RTX toxin-like protein
VDYHARSKNLYLALDGLPNDGAKDEHDNLATDLEVLLAGSGDDVILGNVGTQRFRGGKGDDFLDGGFGADVLTGGTGFDAAGYSARIKKIHADLAGDADDGEAGENDRIEEIEALVGGSGNDELVGNSVTNTLIGGSGADRLTGQGGGDYLFGDAGSDELLGGVGKDGFDGGPGADVIAGGPAFDVVDYSRRHARVRVDLGGGRDDGQSGEHDNVHSDVEGLVGGRGNDLLMGNAHGNGIAGGPGNDTIVGGGGVDGLFGDAGSDALFARDGVRDFVAGGKGSDRAWIDAGLDILRSVEAHARAANARAARTVSSGAWFERLQLVGAGLHDSHVRLRGLVPRAWEIPERL